MVNDGSSPRWGLNGPPAEAYSRLTNTRRFDPLHPFAQQLLRRLEGSFAVRREEGIGLDDQLESLGRRSAVKDLVTASCVFPEVIEPLLPHPTVRLVPGTDSAAAIVVVFSPFPGLFVRFGRWQVDGFPSCGCDACSETANSELGRLSETLDCVTGGEFRESLVLRPDGAVWMERRLGEGTLEFRLADRVGSLTRTAALEILRGRTRVDVDWKPWPAQ
jgi:hypothetical protein